MEQTAEQDLAKFLRDLDQGMKKVFAMNGAPDRPTVEGFVAEHGRVYFPSRDLAHHNLVLRKPKMCFMNAVYGLLDCGRGPNVRFMRSYAEGKITWRPH